MIASNPNDTSLFVVGVVPAGNKCKGTNDPLTIGKISYALDWLDTLGVFKPIVNDKICDEHEVFQANPFSNKCGKLEDTASPGAQDQDDKEPWSVTIIRKLGQKHLCKGFIISPYHVLTTASCVSFKGKLILILKEIVHL